MQALSVGDPAPIFALEDSAGNLVSLADYLGKTTVVLLFYQKDNCRLSTKEACNFAADFNEVERLGAAVIGISTDTSDDHKQFQDKYRIPFPLLSDSQGLVSRTYGIFCGEKCLRSTFIIDAEGTIRQIYSRVNVDVHSEEVQDFLTELAPSNESTVGFPG